MLLKNHPIIYLSPINWGQNNLSCVFGEININMFYPYFFFFLDINNLVDYISSKKKDKKKNKNKKKN